MANRLLLPALLICANLAVFAQVADFDFVNFDDDVYITNNPQVRAGLSWQGLQWALTSGHAANWHPLTWLSHMLDSELFGMAPGPHHLVNLLFHIANTLMLFWLLARMTGRELASAAVALLFAVHPLHVESVAWISERKDVLSTFFGILSLRAYVAYTAYKRKRDYWLVAAFLACSLLAKPMFVTLPFVLLLLDYWPLARMRTTGDKGTGLRELFTEKLPLICLSVASSIITIVAQRGWGAMEIGHEIPLHLRLANAATSYASYLGKAAWPTELSLLYPHPYAPGGLPPSPAFISAAVLLLVAITAAAVRAKDHPYLRVGWLWYLGMLVPVIGVVQVGGQAMADRYTYVPLVGVFIMICFGLDRAAIRWRDRFRFSPQLMIVVVCLAASSLAYSAHQRTRVWQNSLTLLGNAARTTPGNPIIDNHYGAALQRVGRIEEAARYYRQSLRYKPDSPKTHSNLGIALLQLENLDDAAAHFREALVLAPDYVHAMAGLAGALYSQGKLSEAAQYLERASELDKHSADYPANLANTLSEQGRFEEAVPWFIESLAREPNSPAVHYSLATALISIGQIERAVAHLEKSLELAPEFTGAKQSLRKARKQLNTQP